MSMLPQDPFILVSFVNTELRDRFPSLEDFCEDHQVEREDLLQRLERAGFRYDQEHNRFH